MKPTPSAPAPASIDLPNSVNATDALTTDYLRKIRGLFASIELLGHECGEIASGEIVALAEIGTEFADLALNGERGARHA